MPHIAYSYGSFSFCEQLLHAELNVTSVQKIAHIAYIYRTFLSGERVLHTEIVFLFV